MALAVIIPVYNEEKGIQRHIAEIDRILTGDGIEHTFMLVDDGSRDNSWRELRNLCQSMDNVRAIRFARNFGKEVAICAGLDAIDADLYLVMDSDLQHPPRCVRGMLALMEKTGADIVDGVKESRGTETAKTKFLAKSFYKVLELFTGLSLDNSSDFKLMKRSVVDAIRVMPERNRFFRSLVDYVGFERVSYGFATDDRDDGTSRFSTKKLVILAFNAILSNTNKPLYLPLVLASLSGIGAFVMLVLMIVRAGLGLGVTGTLGLLFALLVCTALILLGVGVTAAYLARVYDEVKGRPLYLVSERLE